MTPSTPSTGQDRAAPPSDMRGITRCWQYEGWHVYGAGPCFDSHEQAICYRDELDREGITWKPQPDRYWARLP